MSQLYLFGATPVPVAARHDHLPGNPGIHLDDMPYALPAPVVELSPYVICPATPIGSMDKEHVELGTWEVKGRAMALARRVAVNLYKIETDGAWTPLGRIGADGARLQ